MKRIRKRLTFANVMSSIAVFLVLGGATAIAAGLGKNSVGTRQLKKNAVSAAKIKRNAVTTAKIKKNAITTAKIRNNAVNGNKVKESTLGTVPSAADVTSVKHFKISVGETGAGGQDFLTVGPFTFKVICRINDAGNDSVETTVRSSQDHSAMDASAEQDDMVANTEYTWTNTQSDTTGTQIFEASGVGTQSEGLYSADRSVVATGQTDEGVNLGGQTGQCQVEGFLQLL